MRKRKYTTEEFIDKCKKIHNNKFDYSLVKYINNITKVKIICPEHGAFEQCAKSHMSGIGCPKCSGMYNFTTEDFIKKAEQIHGFKYDYSLVEYINNITKVKIICPTHGVFEQLPSNHIRRSSICPKCNNESKALTTEQFIEKSKKIHNNKYDYSLVKYKNNITKVSIKCNKCCRIFTQTPNSHYIKGQGCPFCIESNGEKQIKNILNEKNIKYIRQKTFEDCVDKYKLRFDFYLPDFNTCVEYDGKQHYEPIEYFGGEEKFQLVKKHDNIKNLYCNKNNIRIIRIKYNQNIEKKLNNIYG